MIRRFSSVKRKIEVDECGNCAGIWLDMGELEQIRSEFNTEHDRTKAAEKCLIELFGVKMADQQNQSQEQLQKAKRIAHAFRFICPSYYLPGKQKSGAF
jgi:Zn-finger nucleic acid-binding protein